MILNDVDTKIIAALARQKTDARRTNDARAAFDADIPATASELASRHGVSAMAQSTIDEIAKASAADQRSFEDALRSPKIGPTPAQTYMRHKRVENLLALGVAILFAAWVGYQFLSAFLEAI